MSTKQKPAMKSGEKLTIDGLTIKCMKSPHSNFGTIGMTIAGVGGDVMHSGKKIGSVYGAIGGGVVIQIGNWTFGADMGEIFRIVYEATKEIRKHKKQRDAK